MADKRHGKDIFVALAAIAWADGQLDPDEADAIVRAAVDEGLSLGERLGIPERPRVHAEGVAREIAELPEGDRPARKNLAALRRTLGDRLRQAQASRRPPNGA